jgi:hypothetical protein
MESLDNTARRHHVKTVLLVLGIICCPLLLCSAFIALSRCLPPFPSGAVEVFGLTVSVVSGLPFIFALPIPKKVRIALSVVYVPTVFVLIMFYTLEFVCSVYGDCL